MPTLGFHVPDDSPLLKEVANRADKYHDGKTSAYVRQLVERDVEGFSIGMPGSLLTKEQIDRWMDDEVALVTAAKHALTVLNGTDPLEKERAARAMAKTILEATLRRPLSEQAKAKEQGYGVAVPRRGAEKESQRKKA